MEIRYKGKLRIFTIAFSGLFMVISSYLIYLFDPLNIIIDKMIVIADGSISFGIWEKPAYEIFLKTYVFNISNGNAFMEGEDDELKVEEIGPFTFIEKLENTDIKFYENGTMSFIPKRELVFLPELSVAHIKDVMVTVPNVPLLGIASMLHQSSYMLNWAVSSIINVLDSKPILNMSMHDYLWGYNDSLVKMASSVLPNWIFFERFGILDRMTDEGINVVTLNVNPDRNDGSPILDEQERGRLYSIASWNGSHGLAHWGYKEPEGNSTPEVNTKCNMIEGAYDGTIFPIHIPKDAVFRLYRKLFCRTVPIEVDHVGRTKEGFEGYWFKIKDDFLDPYQDNPDNECYCLDKNFCLPRGLGDITPCYYGFPAAVSKPHFLDADPIVLNKIQGIKAVDEKHRTNIVINPKTGLLMKGESRMQINLVTRKTLQRRTKAFDNIVIPLVWVEMIVHGMPRKVHMLMTLTQKVLPVVQEVLMYLLGIGGAALIATAGLIVFFGVEQTVQNSPNMNIGYQAVKMIPLTRMESLISENKRTKFTPVQ